MEAREIIRRTHRIAALVGFSVLGAMALYLVLVELIRIKMAPFHGLYPITDPEAVRNLRYLFYGLSAASVLLARILQSLLLRKKPGDRPEDLLNKLHRTSLIMVIMSELPALFGLILFLIRGLYRDFYILLAISVVVLFIFFPRRRAWEEWLLSQT
ncbi:MAG: hypothetical protein OP8BY_2104 [Candidatus Saccharicenans subterraneus]|uniref:Uncharacterized protein n=1 Tax=Candidatus Saccharicenans subterraneus TaxID=2508984 RepID=A0A3E2BMZ7_9BACT|nr:MAG: hypothetical protein OP8BY_2104 [Candidatus Saccharicenans subterraneum]